VEPSAPSDVVSATLSYLARALVQFPDDVRVEQFDGERGPTWRLHVNVEDLGRVIGKSGRVARAIRQVTRAAAARAGTSAFIEIAE
jgi:predicted RNA-binding protein YlqC (UPF0109 family)